MKFYNLIILLIIIFCWVGCDSNPPTTRVTFICLDQFGNLLPDVKIEIDGKLVPSISEGMYKIDFPDLTKKQIFHSVKAEKDGYKFLEPASILVTKNGQLTYPIYLFREAQVTCNVFEGDKPLPNITVGLKIRNIIEGKKGTTDASGECYFTFDPEETGPFLFSVANRRTTKNDTLNSLSGDDTVFIKFKAYASPPPLPESQETIKPKPPEVTITQVKLVVRTGTDYHTIVSPRIAGGEGDKPVRQIVLPSSTTEIVIKLSDGRVGKIPLDLTNGVNFDLRCNFSSNPGKYSLSSEIGLIGQGDFDITQN